MNQRIQPQVVRSYLGELETALAGLPTEIAREIIDGVTEELTGLDAKAAAARIKELGDPIFIAAEAQAESAPVDAQADHADPVDVSRVVATPDGDPRWYTVVASLLVAFGGIVVPVLGWLFGLAMVWMSKTWRTWEKWVATLTAPVVAALYVFVVYWISVSGSEAGNTPGIGAINPLFPTVYDTLWSGIVLLVFLYAVVGLWLLWRGLRTER